MLLETESTRILIDAGKNAKALCRALGELSLTPEQLDRLFAPMPNEEKVIIDVKSLLPKEQLLAAGYRYWRL